MLHGRVFVMEKVFWIDKAHDRLKNLSSVLHTRSDTNRAVQPQKMDRGLKFGILEEVLNSFAVTAKLICAFVFAYSKSMFSHDMAHILIRET